MIHAVFIIYLYRNICTDLVLISSFYPEKKDVVIMSKYNTELHTNSHNGNIILHNNLCGNRMQCVNIVLHHIHIYVLYLYMQLFVYF